jgi:hypothetical protein
MLQQIDIFAIFEIRNFFSLTELSDRFRTILFFNRCQSIYGPAIIDIFSYRNIGWIAPPVHKLYSVDDHALVKLLRSGTDTYGFASSIGGYI